MKRVILSPGVPRVTLLVSWNPLAREGAARSRPLAIALLRALPREVVWRDTVRADLLWNEALRLTALDVPAAVLPPAEYRLELHERGEPRPAHVARFRVDTAGVP